MARFFLLLLCAMLAAPAQAADAPIQYARTTLLITPKAPAAGMSARGIAFDTERRDAAAATRTPGWYNFATLGDYRAAMVTFDRPTPVTIEASSDFAAVDVLMLDSFGTILLIAPSLVPAQMEAAIASPQPVVAVIYLKGGICAKLGIQPGDTVQHSMFKKKPVVLTAPGVSTTLSVTAPTGLSPPTVPAAAPVQPVTEMPSKPMSATQPTNTNMVSKAAPKPPATPPVDENLVNQLLQRYGQ